MEQSRAAMPRGVQAQTTLASTCFACWARWSGICIERPSNGSMLQPAFPVLGLIFFFPALLSFVLCIGCTHEGANSPSRWPIMASVTCSKTWWSPGINRTSKLTRPCHEERQCRHVYECV